MSPSFQFELVRSGSGTPDPRGAAGNWRKSSHSGTGNCVEAGHGPGVVGVRDSALEQSPVLKFGPAAWVAFTAALKAA